MRPVRAFLIAAFILFSGCAAVAPPPSPGPSSALEEPGPEVKGAYYRWRKSLDEDAQEAQLSYERLLALAPQSGWVRYNGGVMYLRLNDHKKAQEEFLEALRLKAQPAKVYNALGLSYYAEDRKPEALDAFRKAYGAEVSVTYSINLANAYMNNSQFKEALSHYKEAAALDPKNRIAHHNMGIAYYKTGDYRKAHEAFTKALSGAGGRDAATLLCLAQTHVRLGEHDKALKIMKDLAGRDLANPELYKNMGILYEIYIGDMAGAIESYSLYVSMKKDGDVDRWIEIARAKAGKANR